MKRLYFSGGPEMLRAPWRGGDAGATFSCCSRANSVWSARRMRPSSARSPLGAYDGKLLAFLFCADAVFEWTLLGRVHESVGRTVVSAHPMGMGRIR